MTSIDELFKTPSLPSGQKRKFEPVRDPNEIYKSAKLDTNGAASGSRAATVDDAEDEDIAGPELPPDFGQEDVPDDEEGRFFGGGVTRDTTNALDFIEQQEKEGVRVRKIDSAWLKRTALNFEKRISKNAELRAKYESDPQKFMASEADLDVDIKGLSILSEHPQLYPEFAELGCVGSLVSLLAHENTDIAIDVIEILAELTDEDVEAESEQWESLVDAMLDADLIELLAQNLSRLDEDIESDRAGVYHILNVLENLSSQSSVAEKIGQESEIMPWLYARIQKGEKSVTQNKQYAAEVLAILLQSSQKNRERFVGLNGVDTLLQLLSVYRKRDPEKDSDEEEYVENLFDSLTCVVDGALGKEKFVEAEGVELAQIMLREGKMSKPRALRVLNHAVGGKDGARVCEQLVEAGLLRTVFGMFMKKQDNQTIEHLLGIFASLLRLLPGESAGRIRTLAKFVEKDYEKVSRLVQFRRGYASKLLPVDQAIVQERANLSKDEQDAMAVEWLSRRLDVGLFSLQIIDVILAWLVAEDDGAKARINSLLSEQDQDLSIIRATLEEQLSGLEGPEGEEEEKDMLTTLLEFI
ncbi:DNA-directed RNA polymerase II polypeptide [Coccidioides immitis RS]|uniref:DNA-directed RNA polymerase II polypeptide n=2 Tax=Coccidioides immitis TaxID=5501 RepID=J3K467_COCIM|nr:DNA-directed RNA polymerase II polypeptide [Coccidioides immitis RS]EAS29068.3 DNA-directed RNA polymerase II polypeptide [Coccidioides immitis RS]